VGWLNLPVTVGLLVIVWAAGAAFFPLGGMIHFLLIMASAVYPDRSRPRARAKF
jgi:hypothetical protein